MRALVRSLALAGERCGAQSRLRRRRRRRQQRQRRVVVCDAECAGVASARAVATPPATGARARVSGAFAVSRLRVCVCERSLGSELDDTRLSALGSRRS